MIQLTLYGEQSGGGFDDNFPSVKTLSTSNYTEYDKKRIVEYLCNNDFIFIASTAMGCKDVFDGSVLDACGNISKDEKYIWTDTLPMYVYKHNIALPDDFIEHVYNFL